MIHPSIIYHRLSYAELVGGDWSLSHLILGERRGITNYIIFK